MQCVEIITKSTIDGEVITYMVKGGTGMEKAVSIDEIDGEVYETADDVKKTLIKRATEGISQRVDNAVAKAKEWYPKGRERSNDDGDEASLIKKRHDQQPPSSKKQKTVKQHRIVSPEVAQLANELQLDNDKLEVQLADGKTAIVRSISLPEALQG